MSISLGFFSSGITCSSWTSSKPFSSFIPIDKKAFIQNNETLVDQIRFEDWKLIKAQHLVLGNVSKNNEKISVEFRLYDVFAQKQLIGKKYENIIVKYN